MRRAAQLVAALLGGAMLAGCGSAHAARVGSKTSAGGVAVPSGHGCGQAYSAGHVPVMLMVRSGSVVCSEAQQVEAAYNHDLMAGLVRGNGGGAPVNVGGWTCQGLPTPRILRTGEVSTCSKDGSRFDAQMASPAPVASAS